MKITVLAILLMMPAYFLVLYGAVGFIQDKRFFGSAPKENLAAIPDKNAERSSSGTAIPSQRKGYHRFPDNTA